MVKSGLSSIQNNTNESRYTLCVFFFQKVCVKSCDQIRSTCITIVFCSTVVAVLGGFVCLCSQRVWDGSMTLFYLNKPE